MTRPVFRFAPSPNGAPHLGHAFSALTNAALAEREGGRFLLRIEDIDLERCLPEHEERIYRDLAWLGLDWERPVRRQSEHFDAYRAALDRLVGEGLAYPAFMSRGEVRSAMAEAEAAGRIWPKDPDGVPVYPETDRKRGPEERKARIAAGEPFTWRLDTAAALRAAGGPLQWLERGEGSVLAHPLAWGDVMIASHDVPARYHLAVVVDDAAQGVTDVVRGRDLYHATAVHRLLQELLGLPAPRYFHHRLILDTDGRKLSKSRHDTSLEDLRQAGATPAGIREMTGFDPDSPGL